MIAPSAVGTDDKLSKPELMQLLRSAAGLAQSGRHQEAIQYYERVLANDPTLPNTWYNLARLQRHSGAFESALQSYARSLSLGVPDPEEVHLNRAVIFSDDLQQNGNAERELEAALAIKATYVPALLNLGNLHEDAGNRDAARSAYERALSASPNDNLALARLAGVSRAEDLESGLGDRLQRRIADIRLPASERADLGFALTRLLDEGGEYDRAFDAARLANGASRESSGAHYDRAAVERFIDASIAAFSEPAPQLPPSSSPLFICGMFRSGSTLTDRILGAHSAVRDRGELLALPSLVRTIGDYPAAVMRANAEQRQGWRDAYVSAQLPIASKALLLTDKRPDNFLHIGLIKSIFPDAKIIHTYREPLDNLISLYFLHLHPSMPYALDLDDAAHWFNQYRRLMAHWKSLYPDDIIDVDYDRLVQEPSSAVRNLVAQLGLPWEDGLLDFYRRGGAVRTASVWQVREPIHARSSGRWRNYEAHLVGVQASIKGAQST